MAGIYTSVAGHVDIGSTNAYTCSGSEKIGVSPLKQNGQVISDCQIQAKTLNNQFSSVYTKEGDTPLPETGASPHPDYPNISIT